MTPPRDLFGFSEMAIASIVCVAAVALQRPLFISRVHTPVAMGPASELAAPAAALEAMDEAAISLDATAARPKRGSDGRLLPVLTLPGDTLETTRLMTGITVISTVTMLAVVGRALLSSPPWLLFSLALAAIAGELFSGAFHWATARAIVL